jgi:hypothetical protein
MVAIFWCFGDGAPSSDVLGMVAIFWCFGDGAPSSDVLGWRTICGYLSGERYSFDCSYFFMVYRYKRMVSIPRTGSALSACFPGSLSDF